MVTSRQGRLWLIVSPRLSLSRWCWWWLLCSVCCRCSLSKEAVFDWSVKPSLRFILYLRTRRLFPWNCVVVVELIVDVVDLTLSRYIPSNGRMVSLSSVQTRVLSSSNEEVDEVTFEEAMECGRRDLWVFESLFFVFFCWRFSCIYGWGFRLSSALSEV